MSSCPKGCVSVQGLGFTFVVMIIAIFTVIMSVSNCIVYTNLIRKDDVTIAKGWSIFLLATNVILAIIGFAVFFWTLYRFFKGRSQIKQEIAVKYQAFAGPEGYLMKTSNQVNDVFQRKTGYVPKEQVQMMQQQEQSFSNTNPFLGNNQNQMMFHNSGVTVGQLASEHGEGLSEPYLSVLKGVESCSDGNDMLKCPQNTNTDIALNRLYTQFYSQ